MGGRGSIYLVNHSVEICLCHGAKLKKTNFNSAKILLLLWLRISGYDLELSIESEVGSLQSETFIFSRSTDNLTEGKTLCKFHPSANYHLFPIVKFKLLYLMSKMISVRFISRKYNAQADHFSIARKSQLQILPLPRT